MREQPITASIFSARAIISSPSSAPTAPPPDVDIGPLCVIYKLGGTVDFRLFCLADFGKGQGGFRFKFAFGRLNVFGNVHKDGASAPRTGNSEGLAHVVGEIFHLGDKKVVFCYGEGDPGDVDFLKAVLSDEGKGDVAGDGHKGNRIQHGGGNSRSRDLWRRGRRLR